MAKNENLSKAKKEKQDEFYTQYEDIQQELNHYEKHFRGKTILCNCDDPFESNFCKFFLRNFNYLGLKRLICTSYASSTVVGKQMCLFDSENEPLKRGNGYVMDITEVPMKNGRGVSDEDIERLLKSKKRGVKKLKGDGDFRSDECVEYLKQADIVVTNPPFSLFREYVALLMEFDKKFLIIGNQNAITTKEIFPLIKENKLWLGFKSGDMAFTVPDSYEPRATRFWVDESGQKWRSMGNICWYTNLDHDKRHEELVLYKHYYGSEEEYPKYDNYDAINVDKTADIPCDYFEDMGVPITYLDKHNPEQFEVVGADFEVASPVDLENGKKGTGRFYLEETKKGIDIGEETGHDLTDRQTDRQTDAQTIQQNHHQAQDVTESWEFPSRSLTSTVQNNLLSSDLTDMSQIIRSTGIDSPSMAEKHTQESSLREKCNGIMGVPITFLDKYDPDQFEILDAREYGKSEKQKKKTTMLVKDNDGTIGGKTTYVRILIRRRGHFEDRAKTN